MFWRRKKVGREMFRPYELAVIDALLERLSPEASAIVARQIEATTYVQRILDDEDVEIAADKGKIGDPALALPNRARDYTLASVGVSGKSGTGVVTVGTVYGHVFELAFRPSPKKLGLQDAVTIDFVKLHLDPMAPDDPAVSLGAMLARLDPTVRDQLNVLWFTGSAADLGLLDATDLYEVHNSDGTYLMLGQLQDTTMLMARIDPQRPGVTRFDPDGDVIGHYQDVGAALLAVGAPLPSRVSLQQPVARGAAGAGRPDSRASSPLLPAPSSAGLSLASGEPRALHVYLEYVGGVSSKFYAVSLEEEAGGTWRVRFNFGRIGFPRAWGVRIEGAKWPKAANAYVDLIEEKRGKGYEVRQWPPYLQLPDGGSLEEDASSGGAGEPDEVLFRAAKRGSLPPATGGSIAGVPLPDGVLYAPIPEGGSRGEDPVIWGSARPVPQIGRLWARLAAAFPESGVWPLVVDTNFGFSGFDDRLMDVPRGRHKEVQAILRKGWNDMVGFDEDDPDEEIAPFSRQFPGLAAPTPGRRPTSIDDLVASATGHLALVGVNRPADVLDAVGWMGAANYDADPLDMSTVLRSWEVRFDAYLVGLGTDTLQLAVGRPPRDSAAATAIAAEHFAFCPDNIQQGAGSIREYARLLVNEQLWPFWWD